MGGDEMTRQLQAECPSPIETFLKANALRRQDHPAEALSLYQVILRETGTSSDVLAAIAYCYSALACGNPKETGENHQLAIDWIKKAIALSPDDARLHACLAEYYWLGIPDYEQAAKEYRTAISLAPYHLSSLVNAAALYGSPEEVVTLEEAITWLERATSLEPNDPNWHARLGELYHQAGRLLDAKQEWRRALLCPKLLEPGYAQIIAEAIELEST